MTCWRSWGLPAGAPHHLHSTNMIERLTRALRAETHEAWLDDNCYIDMDLLREERKERWAHASRMRSLIFVDLPTAISDQRIRRPEDWMRVGE